MGVLIPIWEYISHIGYNLTPFLKNSFWSNVLVPIRESMSNMGNIIPIWDLGTGNVSTDIFILSMTIYIYVRSKLYIYIEPGKRTRHR